MRRLLILGLSLPSIWLVSGRILEARTNVASPTSKQIEKLAQEWRQTYPFKKENNDLLQENLETVVFTYRLIHQSKDLKPELKNSLEQLQADAMKKIVNRGKELTPYLIREFVLLKKDSSSELATLETSLRTQIQSNLRARQEAVEATLKSIGITAIPQLSDFQARAVQNQVPSLAAAAKRLINEIVRIEELTSPLNAQVAEGSERQRQVDFDASGNAAVNPSDSLPEPMYGNRP